MNCVSCDRPMIRRGAPPQGGMIHHAACGMCHTCYYQGGDTPIRVARSRPCPRCGVERETRNSTTLCRDCRSVLSRAEIARWAA